MKEIKAIIQPFMLDQVLEALSNVAALPGLTVSQVKGWGRSRDSHATARGPLGEHEFAGMIKVEIVVPDDLAPSIADIIAKAARTGNIGDGKIFTIEVAAAIKIRTGEHGEQAL